MASLDAVNPDRLLRDIATIVNGVMPEVIRNELNATVRDFCRRSNSLKDDVLDTLPAGSNELMIADVNGLKAIKVLAARTGDGAIIYEDPLLRQRAPTGIVTPRRYYCPAENKMVFEGAPQADLPLTLMVAFCPRADSASVPEDLYEQRYEGLKAGTLGRLYMQPNKPYSNLALGRLNMGSFVAAVSIARVEALQELTKADPPAPYPRWA